MTPRKQILSRIKIHLLTGASITPQECIKLYNGYRLSSVIHRLRKYGLSIKTEIVTLKDGGSFASYSIPKTKLKNHATN